MWDWDWVVRPPPHPRKASCPAQVRKWPRLRAQMRFHGLEALRGRLEGVRGSTSCTSQLFLVTSSVMVDVVVTEVGAVTVILAQLLAPGPLAK